MTMKNTDEMISNNHYFLRKLPLLSIGFVLILLSNMRGSAGIFAWFASVPFLIYVLKYHGVKSRLLLFIFLLPAVILSFMKAASAPFFISMGFSIMIGMVISLRLFLSFIFWAYIRKHTNKLIGIIAFPVIVISFEYIQAFYTPFGDWGSFANTQLYNLPLLQTASLFGFLGISAVMAWGSVLAATIISEGNLRINLKQISAFVIVLSVLLVYGDLRLNKVPPGDHFLIAGITVNNEFTGAFPDPNDPAVVQNTEMLINKTNIAADRGASIVVWGEGSTLISEENESQFIDKLSATAKSRDITIIAAYAVPVSKTEIEKYNFLNKFSWISNEGELIETYLKHHPVPGEGSKKGTAPLRVLHTSYGNLSGAICYDYDFPNMALTQAKLGADMVVVPGMDWRGMLFQHTQMAGIRAIEGGFSVFRAANNATSMGFNNYGQIRGAMPDFGNNDRILITSLPVGKVRTLYSIIGNLPAYLSIVILLILLSVSINKHIKIIKSKSNVKTN